MDAPAAPLPVPAFETPPGRDIKLTPPAEMAQQTRVALLLPLSGEAATLGDALLDAALLAQFEVADGDFILMPFDTGGNALDAEAAAGQAVSAGAELIIGPVFADAVAGAAPVVAAAGLNMLAFSNDSAVARPGVFLSGLLPETQISRVVGYAARHGVQRIAALLPTGPLGERVRDALEATLRLEGSALTDVRYFGPSDDEIAASIREIGDYDRRRFLLEDRKRELGAAVDEVSRRALERLNRLETLGDVSFDALVIAASGDQLTNIAAQLGNFDIDTKRVRLLGLSSWGAERTGREPTLVGSWFAAPPQEQSSAFKRDYKAMFEADPHPLAQTAFDMVALAAILAAREDETKFSGAVLTSENGFAGSGGVFRFSPDGVSERLLEVREVQPWGSKRIESSPESFIRLQN